jgi:hypothetical protein
MNQLEAILNEYAVVTIEAPADIVSKYAHLRISANTPIAKPRTILSINGVQIATPGNIVAISGAPKTGKTAITGSILSGSICTSNGYDGCPLIQVAENVNRKAVIAIDTEQSSYHNYNNLKHGVLKRAQLDCEPDNLFSYNIRELSFSQYKRFADEIFYSANELCGGVHLAVIDGIADFISSVNDEAEANSILEYFAHLSIKYDTAIFLVVHLNPGSDKERGHLGSQLQRKCESVLTIKKDGDVSILEGKFLRSGSISDCQAIQYKFDTNKGYHTFLGDAPRKNGNELKQLAETIFSVPRKYVDAVKLVMEEQACKDRTAKQRITDMLNADLLAKSVVDGSTYYSLKNIPDDYIPF